MGLIKNNFLETYSILKLFIENKNNFRIIENAGYEMVKAIKRGNKIISCGNGGSMSDAMHFAEELTGKFRENRKGIPAIAISDPSFITCTANDYGYNAIFSRFVEAVGKSGDILLAISTSGNSENVVNAAKAAKEKNILVVALTGKDGGELSKLANIEIRVPHFGYADRIQEIHIQIIHSLIHFVEDNLTKEKPSRQISIKKRKITPKQEIE